MIKSELKQKKSATVEAKCGVKIRSILEAQQLSDIMLSVGINLSTHTLARFFGVIKPERRHYLYTFNLIANYLGYKDYYEWEQFTLNKDIFSSRLLLSNQFPLQELELFLISDAIDDIETILKNHHSEQLSPYKFMVSNLLGFHVRHSAKKNDLLNLLSKYDLGRELYFETYVDEDNPQLFFSKAIKELYLPTTKDSGKIIFANTFYETQQIYAGKEPIIDSNLLNLDLKSNALHPHEISRHWEYFFLVKIPKSSLKEINKNLDKLLNETSNYLHDDKCWFLARTIRAFAFHNKLDILTSHTYFMEFCLQLNLQEGEFLNTIAALFLQTLLLSNIEYRAHIQRVKTTPSHEFTNESHNKVLLENICKYYLHKEQLGENHRSKILEAGKYLGKNWVRGFL